MQENPENPWEIRPARNPREQRQALSLMISENEPEAKERELEKIFASVRKGQLDLTHLLIATTGRNILAAQLMIAQQDKTAILWPAAIDPAFPGEAPNNPHLLESIQETLLKKTILLAQKEACVQIQTTVEHDDTTRSAFYERNGLPAIGELLYMQRPASRCPPTDNPCESRTDLEQTEDALKLVPVTEGISDEFLGELLQGTYIESADFPELQHNHDAYRSLLTHRLQGEYHPKHWFVIKQNETAAGVLFFSWHPDIEQWELTYLGILPEFRGKGIAGKAIGKSFQDSSRNNNPVFLGVDSRNHYAIKVYESHGFVLLSRQRVHVLLTG